MNIFEAEKLDNLEERLSNRVVALLASPRPVDIHTSRLQGAEGPIGPEAKLSKAASNQPDLYYLETILVSTGWNLNDDVFVPAEVWSARETPEDKPFNFEHVGDDIIGHITSNQVIDETGKVILGESPPSRFHIVTGAVLYRYWENEEKRSRMDKIISEISESKWFVSMECLYNDFDYALRNVSTGKERVVARNEATAFLTKHLRAFGGSGTYQSYKVGRLLRGIVFCGKGLVRQPANPESVILSAHASAFAPEKITEKFESDETLKNPENPVYVQHVISHEDSMNELEKEIATLKAKFEVQEGELKKAQASVASLKDELDKSAKENSELRTIAKSAKTTVESLEKTKAELTSQLEAINKEKVLTARLAKASKVFDTDEAKKFVETSKDFSEENFSLQLDIVSATIEKKAKPPVIEKTILEKVQPKTDAALVTVPADDDTTNFMKSVAKYFESEEK